MEHDSAIQTLKKHNVSLGFHEKSWNFHDSRGRTDTPGPGESVSAIQGPQKSQENRKIRGQHF